MTRPYRRVCIYLLAIALFSMTAWADQFVVGILVWGVHSPGSAGSFDISNQTGVNSTPLGDDTYPVVTSLTFSGLSLNVHFTDGSSTVKGPSYFTANGIDGGFNGGDIPIGGANPLPDYAQLTASAGPLSITLNDGSTVSILSDLVIDPLGSVGGGGLADGDIAVIYAQTGTSTAPVPEPGSWLLLLTCIGGVVVAIRRKHIFVQGGSSL